MLRQQHHNLDAALIPAAAAAQQQESAESAESARGMGGFTPRRLPVKALPAWIARAVAEGLSAVLGS